MQTWHEAIGAEKQQPYFQHIIHSVHNEREAGQIVYPPAADVFNAAPPSSVECAWSSSGKTHIMVPTKHMD